MSGCVMTDDQWGWTEAWQRNRRECALTFVRFHHTLRHEVHYSLDSKTFDSGCLLTGFVTEQVKISTWSLFKYPKASLKISIQNFRCLVERRYDSDVFHIHFHRLWNLLRILEFLERKGANSFLFYLYGRWSLLCYLLKFSALCCSFIAKINQTSLQLGRSGIHLDQTLLFLDFARARSCVDGERTFQKLVRSVL